MSLVAPKDVADFTQAFPLRPFALRHAFADNPLFTLPRIVDLVRQLPSDQIEYNSGKAAISQDPYAVPTLDLDPAEVVRQIETAGAWMVLKQIEIVPAYKALLEEALMSVARARGHLSLEEAGFEDIRGFLFVSSAESTTPFHADTEDNFFVHIFGEKFFHVYDNRDRSVASEDALEDVVAKHRNLTYDPAFDAKGTTYHLFPGDGVFVPYQWPHWVRTGASHSISLAITWKTKAVRRRNDIFTVNSLLRGFGLPQPAPGRNPALDQVKVAALRTARGVVAPLRRSEGMRRLLRRIALGRNANYYYRGDDKKPAKKTARAS